MKPHIKLFLCVAVLVFGCVCHAQNSELHLSVMCDLGKGPLFPVNYFGLELSSEDYSYKTERKAGQWTPGVYQNVPEGPLFVRIDDTGISETKPFSDSIVVHKGVSAVIIELDSSGERKSTLTDFDGNELPITPELARITGTRLDGTFSIPKPARPRYGTTSDGLRVLYSRAFTLIDGSVNPAIEYMEESGWAKTVQVDFEPGYGLILLDPDVHWSWKNGVYSFWKDE